MIVFLITICVAISVWLLCILFSKPSSILYVSDDPTHRSLHNVSKPRTGGIAIFIVLLIAWLVIAIMQSVESFIYYLIIGMCVLAVISYIDDRYSISQIWRLITHILAALLFILGGLSLSAYDFPFLNHFESGIVLNFITIVLIVWMINLYNFMDGMDGLAGGMGFIGFACLGLLGWFAENNLYMLMAFIVAATNLGFLLHNFPPAKIFMGDIGSITLGYMVAFFLLWGINSGIFRWWAPILIFSPFIVDATLTLLRRLLCREKIWEAHKSHYYQRLVQNGWGHRKTAIFEYILMMATSISVIILMVKDNVVLTTYTLVGWSLLYIIIIIFVSSKNSNSVDIS